MKERTRKSPDLADAVAVLTELFIQRAGLKYAKVAYEGSDYQTQWGKFQQKRSLEAKYTLAQD